MSAFSKLTDFVRFTPRRLWGLQLSEAQKVTYDTLSNGARLVTRRAYGARNVNVMATFLGAGSMAESRLGVPAGTAHFLAVMIQHEISVTVFKVFAPLEQLAAIAVNALH